MAVNLNLPGGTLLPPPTQGGGGISGDKLLPPPDMSQVGDFVKQQQAAQAPMMKQVAQNTGQVQNIAGQMGQESIPQAPQLQGMAQAPKDDFRDPMNAFASAGSLLTLLGSLKTRHPMTTAMNAAAQMVNGYHAGDKERIAQNRQKWVDSVAQSKDQNQTEIDQYKAIMDSKTMSRDQKAAQINALAAANKDQLGLAAVASGNLDIFGKILEARVNSVNEINKTLLAMGFMNPGTGGGGSYPAGPSGAPKGLPGTFPDTLSFMNNPKEKQGQMAKISEKDDVYLEKLKDDVNAVQSLKDSSAQFMALAGEQGTGFKSGVESYLPNFMTPQKVQEMNKINTQLSALQSRAMTSRPTNFEFARFKDANLSPSNKPETNQAIANATTAFADRIQDYHQYLSEYKTANPAHNLEGAEDAWMDYLRDVPLFDKTSGFNTNPNWIKYTDYFDAKNELVNAGLSEDAARDAIVKKFGPDGGR